MTTTTTMTTGARKIKAKFSSKCTNCKQPVGEGSDCLWVPNTKGVTHVDCSTVTSSTIVLTAQTLKDRLSDLNSKLDAFQTAREDFLAGFNASEAEKPVVCTTCNGRGYANVSWNTSETLDYTSFEHYNHRCGAKLTASYIPATGWFGGFNQFEVDGVPSLNEVVTVPYFGSHKVTIHGGLNQNCVDTYNEFIAWSVRNGDAELAFDTAFPTYRQVQKEIELCESDMEIRRGDIATVINRGKAFTGTVIFVGEGQTFGYARYTGHSGPQRVTVSLPDGTTKGGSHETAVFVSREASFSNSK